MSKDFFVKGECDSRVRQGTLLGEGAYGRVYRGTYKESPEKEPIEVAIKKISLVPKRRTDTDVLLTAKNLIDAVIGGYLYGVGCPVARVYRAFYCTDEPGVYKFVIVMELVKGVSLFNYSLRKLSESVKMELTRQILHGISCLNNHDIYHRDIKSDNIMIDLSKPEEGPKVKIIDFGLSCADTDAFKKYIEANVEEDMANNLMGYLCPGKTTGQRVGSPLYCPPEEYGIFKDEKYIDIRKIPDRYALKDAFAVGCLLYELWFVGAGNMLPEMRTTHQLSTYYTQVLNGDKNPLVIPSSNAPEWLISLVSSLMEYDYFKRITLDKACITFDWYYNKYIPGPKGTTNSENPQGLSVAASSGIHRSPVGSPLGSPVGSQEDESRILNILMMGNPDVRPIRLARGLVGKPPLPTDKEEKEYVEVFSNESYNISVDQSPAGYGAVIWKQTVEERINILDVVMLFYGDDFEDRSNVVIYAMELRRELPHYVRVVLVSRGKSNPNNAKMAKDINVDYIEVPLDTNLQQLKDGPMLLTKYLED